MATKKSLGVDAMRENIEHEALDRDFRDHSLWLVALARRHLGSSNDVEDVVQEAYIRAARYPESRRERPRSLLARILRNLINDRARSRKREQAGRRTIAAVADLGIAQADQHDLLVIKQIILDMPETYREVFLLSRFTTLSQQAIAKRLGISVKTVEWRLSKALAYCAQRIAE